MVSRRPFTDADTTFMPELHHTMPMARIVADAVCTFCGIRLTAIPDSPVLYTRHGSPVGDYFHPACAKAQRTLDALV